MPLRFRLGLSAFLALALTLPALVQTQGQGRGVRAHDSFDGHEVIAGEVLVRFRDGTDAPSRDQARRDRR